MLDNALFVLTESYVNVIIYAYFNHVFEECICNSQLTQKQQQAFTTLLTLKGLTGSPNSMNCQKVL
jgi:hypothetical protein